MQNPVRQVKVLRKCKKKIIPEVVKLGKTENNSENNTD